MEEKLIPVFFGERGTMTRSSGMTVHNLNGTKPEPCQSVVAAEEVAYGHDNNFVYASVHPAGKTPTPYVDCELLSCKRR
ncbi:hypothetical protein PHAVU_005G065900 [Phaseolus vulgaris]|uniref:Uncharacterized protein n=1 Tax=Phaseolus vulgaris TaxID=3885 RepID=V7BWG0_PHAVU|nr:hypothetical protein PHAVU_005G065900g [Phaseolus vulgaris]ESW21380.1 hypothetical protein PHAVU_005G065900g [Phaseolus vulgaris]